MYFTEIELRVWKEITFFFRFNFEGLWTTVKKSHISSKVSSYLYFSLVHACQRPIGFHFNDNSEWMAGYVDDDEAGLMLAMGKHGQTHGSASLLCAAVLLPPSLSVATSVQNSGDRSTADSRLHFWYFHFTNCISPWISSLQTSSLIRACTQTPKRILTARSVTHCQWLSCARICFCKTQPAWFLRCIAVALLRRCMHTRAQRQTRMHIPSSYPEWALWCLLPI